MNALMKLRKSLSMQAGDYEVLVILSYCLQCFDAVGWAAGRASGL